MLLAQIVRHHCKPECLAYDELGIIAKSVSEGLLFRVDVKTPDIGTGYANVIINPFQPSMPMHGEVAFNDVQLKVLKPFIQDVRFEWLRFIRVIVKSIDFVISKIACI